MVTHSSIEVLTKEYNCLVKITDDIRQVVEKSKIRNGVVYVITAHTTTGIAVNEYVFAPSFKYFSASNFFNAIVLSSCYFLFPYNSYINCSILRSIIFTQIYVLCTSTFQLSIYNREYTMISGQMGF